MKPRLDLLILLANYLQKVEKETFNMDSWQDKTPCGTTCCAIGHACQIKEFKDAGLRLGEHIPEPQYQHMRGFKAVSECLNLTENAVYDLFDPAEYEEYPHRIPKAAVVKRIRNFIAKHTQEKEGNQLQ